MARAARTLGGLCLVGGLGPVIACTTVRSAQGDSSVTPETVRFVPAPPGLLAENPQWMPDRGEIVVTLRPPRGSRWESHPAAVRPDASAFQRLPLPDDPECKRTSRHFAKTLPDGRLGYVQRCWGSQTRRLPEEEVTLMVHNPASAGAERLVPYYLPVNANYFDFSPDMQMGIINDGVGLRERLWWLRPDRLEPLGLPLERAGFPRWSPDGTRIALDGAPEGAEMRGVARLDLPQTLYLLAADRTELHPLLSGLTNAGLSNWSPDGRWLVAWLHFEGGRHGLWLVEAATGKLLRVEMGERVVGSATWSPDGRSLVASAGIDADHPYGAPGEIGLYLIDLPDLDNLATVSGG